MTSSVDVIVETHQMPPLEVPEPWQRLPVTPARVRWRVRRGGLTVRPWHTPIDFTKRLLPQEDFHRIYAPGIRQNRPEKPPSSRRLAELRARVEALEARLADG